MQKHVKTYKEFHEWIALFNTGALDILIVEGSPGTGKSSIIRHSLDDIPATDYCWLEGRVSAPALYEKLYDYRDLPIYLDDVDSIYTDRQAVNLLKCLCQTEDNKRLYWEVKRKLADYVPNQFETASTLCLITNKWKTLSKHVSAVVDRGILLTFQPSKGEIHNYVNQFVSDERSEEQLKEHTGEHTSKKTVLCEREVYDYIGENIGLIRELSIRLYAITQRLKNNGMHWKESLIDSYQLPPLHTLVLTLLETFPDEPQSQLSWLFSQESGKSIRSFYRVKQELAAMRLTE